MQWPITSIREQERLETGLSKMNIRRECLGDVLRFHQRERQTVGQSPFLVGSGEISNPVSSRLCASGSI